MREISRTQKAMVILQILLTFGTIAYELRYGFMKFHPATTKDILTVVLEYGFLGLLYSPFAFLYIICYCLCNYGYNFINSLPDKITALPNELSIPLMLLYVPVSIFFVYMIFYISFLPPKALLGNLDYAFMLLVPGFGKAVKQKYAVSKSMAYNDFDDRVYLPREPELPAVETSIVTNRDIKEQPVNTRNPNAFEKLVGVDKAIEEIKDALELPLLYPEKVKEYGITPSKGLLLCGPPGTGKTSLARATAEYFGCYFAYVKGSELVGPYAGSSEEAVKTLFAKAKANKPAIIFFDEIDAICRKRDGAHLNRASDIVLNILLAEMDGFERNDGLFIMGATNRADILDEAVLRPGRFDSIIELKLPDIYARSKLFWLFLNDKPVAETLETKPFAEQTEGMSPAQIESICKKAATRALKRELSTSEIKHGLRISDVLEAIEEERQGKRKW